MIKITFKSVGKNGLPHRILLYKVADEQLRDHWNTRTSGTYEQMLINKTSTSRESYTEEGSVAIFGYYARHHVSVGISMIP